ncbi:MAG TPA: Ig-like domain-containing protein [Verrucomicrobiae bacterium]|nr:Ig-like domain-containing protein [Verrucomicrobiae bacterium]
MLPDSPEYLTGLCRRVRIVAVLFAVMASNLVSNAADGPGFPNLDYPQAWQGQMLLTNNTGKAISGVAMHRGYLMVPMGADHGGGLGAGAIAFYDISNLANPQPVFDSRDFPAIYHTAGLTNYVGDFAEAHHISVSGNYVLCSERSPGSGGFSILDVSNVYDADPNTRPMIVCRFVFPNGSAPSNYDIYSFAPAWQGSRFVFAPTGSGGLEVIDTGNFNNPIRLKHLTRSELANLTVRAGVAIGNLLILSTSAVESTFQALILDIGDPGNPQQVGNFGGALGYQGFVYGSSFYGGGNPLQRHDFTDPANVITTTLASGAALSILDRPEYVFGQDEYLFVGHYPGSTKWLLTNDTATFVARVDSGLVDDHAFGTPLGNLVAVTTDHANTRKLMIGIHDFQKDSRPPAVTFTSPANGATNVHVKSRVGLCFTDFIDPMSLSTTSLIVRAIGGPALAGSYSALQGIVNFVPAAPLETNRTYEVILAANGVRDYAGNAITNETVVLQFATGPSVLTYSTDVVPDVPSLVGSTVDLSLAVNNPTEFTLEHAWEFGDGSPVTAFSSATNATHTYTNAGNFVVTAHTRIVGQTTVYKATAAQVIHRVLPAERPVNSSTIVYDAANARVWNVNPDNNTVTAINATNYFKISETLVGQDPKALALGPGNALWVVNKKAATISVINRATGGVITNHALPYACAPHGIVVNVATSRAYVALEALGRVVELDATTGVILRTVDVGPWPRGLALDPIQGTLWVGRFISPDDAGKVTVIDLGTFAVSNVVSLALVTDPDTQTSGSGLPNYLGPLAISPDYSHVFVPAKKDNIHRGILRNGQHLTFEHTMRSMASSIDLATRTETPSRRLDLDNSDFATSVAFSPLGNQVFFTANGSATIWVVDAYTSRVQDAFTFGSGGMAPDGLTLSADGKRLFVHNFMSRSVTVFSSTAACGSICGTTPLLATVSTVASEALPPAVLRGKQLFYDSEDTRLSSDSYMSCASCHLDGGQDGRVWDFTGFGEGLRNTIDLNGRGVGHGPVHWTANFDEVHDFEGQIRTLGGGTGLMSDKDFNSGTVAQPLGQSKAGFSSDLDALAAYVGSLTNASKSPHRQPNGQLTPDAILGREIFRQQNCAACHSGTAFSDSASLARHDVGTLLPSSGQRLGAELDGLDTPTLRGLWKTAPYLHDGSAATLRDVLVTRNIAGKHGYLFSLSESEIDQLVAYLNQIDDLELTAPTSSPNSPPVLATLINQITPLFQATSLTVSASDPNGDPLSYHALGLPAGLALDPDTGVISGAPSAPGLYTVHLSVLDSRGGSDSQTITWTVGGAVTTIAGANFWVHRYVKLVSDSSVNGDVWTTIAEFNVYHTNGTLLDRSGWVVTADSEEVSAETAPATRAIDGSTSTFWHTKWSGSPVPAHPHELIVDLGSPQPIGGFTYLPRQNNINGRIKDWRFHWSDDGIHWGDPVASGTFTNSTALQSVQFSAPALGSIARYYWTNISGSSLSSLTNLLAFPHYPDGTSFTNVFEGPPTFGDFYGTRMFGYLIPPTSGDYTFWIASDDNSELWLSRNHEPANAEIIASVPVWTDPREWTKFPSQRSMPVTLEAGVMYYIQALQKEGNGGDNLAVAWQGPGLPGTNVIAGQYLMPFIPVSPNQPPAFINASPTFTVLENAPVSTLVGTMAATDPEMNPIAFAITGGNVGSAFGIHPTSGVITVQGSLNYETRSRYDLTVRAQDNGLPARAAAINVVIQIGNVLENNDEVVRVTLSQPGGLFAGHANPALIGFGADPDFDGWPNALELLFGTDASLSDDPGPARVVPELLGNQTFMAYEFDTRAAVANLLRFRTYGSADFLEWAELTNAPVVVNEAGGWRTYRVRDDAALSEVTTRAMRLGISPSDTVP